MATGITKREQLGPDARMARTFRSQLADLPPADAVATLSYPGKLPGAQVLAPLETAYRALGGAWRACGTDRIEANAVVLGDNLFALHHLLEIGSRATLVYLDPPYGTGMEFHSRDLEHAYRDRYSPASYLEFMRRRLILMRELLKPEGSIYLQIGHQMLAHMKVLLDEIFGPKCFRNIIVRKKCSSKNWTSKQYANVHDYILFYTKGPKYVWNQPCAKPSEDWLEKEYDKVDKRGRYKLVPIHAPGTRHGESGKPWRGMQPPPGKHWQYAPSTLDELDTKGEIHWSKNGNPRRKVYLTSDKLVPLTDYWSQFRDAHHQSIAITGYPTEKNFDMMKTIVGASSNEGDLVVDPFCGSGTTLHAANELGRKWIGMDKSFSAVKACLDRLRYGLQPMGDFVTERPKRTPDMFSAEFRFYADAALRDDEVRELTELCA